MNGGKTTTVPIAICQNILETKELPREWTKSLATSFPEKDSIR